MKADFNNIQNTKRILMQLILSSSKPQNPWQGCDKSFMLVIDLPTTTLPLYPGLGPAVTTAGRESGD